MDGLLGIGGNILVLTDFGGAALTMIPSFMYIFVERVIFRGNTSVMGAR